MSCKYLCQVGTLKYASTCSDRCEFPVGAAVIECIWGSGLLPLRLPRPGHQRHARALPPSSSERSCDWECWTLCLLWLRLRERQMEVVRGGDEGRKRQRKDRGRDERADSPNRNIQFLYRQQSLFSLCWFMPWSFCKVSFKQQASGQRRNRHDLMLVCGCYTSRRHRFTVVSSF